MEISMTRLGITDGEINKIAEKLLHTCDSIDGVLYHLGYDFEIDSVEDRLLDINVETCGICGWWVESHMMVDTIMGNPICISCDEFNSEV